MILKRLALELEKKKALSGMLNTDLTYVEKSGGNIHFGGKKYVDFTNKDIFDLQSNPFLKKTLHADIERGGATSTSSRIVGGISDSIRSCETRLAKFLGMESSILFPTYNQAVLTLITNVFSELDTLIVAEGVFAPVIDSANLCGMQVAQYTDASSLESLLSRMKDIDKKYLYLELHNPYSPYSINPTVILDLAIKFNLEVILDDSYSLGTIGNRGAGTLEIYHIIPKIMCIISRLDHFSSQLSLVAGSLVLKNYLINFSKTLKTETLPPSSIFAYLDRSVDIVELSLQERKQLSEKSKNLSTKFLLLGMECIHIENSPYFSLIFKNSEIARIFKNHLLTNGFHCDYYSTSVNFHSTCFVPIYISIRHTEIILESFLRVVADIAKKIKML